MSSDQRCILDTSTLLYFLLVEQDQLLRDLLGDPLTVPQTVYDPEDRNVGLDPAPRSDLLSEMRQSIAHYEVATRSGGAAPHLLDRVRGVDALFDAGHLEVVELAEDEAALAAELESRAGAKAYGLKLPLGVGEAACVAITCERSWVIATDDNDALKVLDRRLGEGGYEYERIRKLLVRAANEGRITKKQANEIHAEMKSVGFRDDGVPFEGS